MPRNTESRTSGAVVEIPQPSPGAAFESGAVAAEARALRRAGGDVGHGVEGGVGVFAEFLEVAVQAGFQIGVEFSLFVARPRFRVLRQLRPAGDLAGKRSAFLQSDPNRPNGGEGFPEFLAEVRHPGEGAGDFQRVDALRGVWHGQGRGFLLEDHAVGAVLAEKTDVDPQGAAAVVAAGDADEGCEGFRRAAFVAPKVHRVRPVVDVHRRPAPGARAMAFHERPLRRGGVQERFKAELVAQRHRLLIGEHLVTCPDNAKDVAGIGSNEGFFVRYPHISRHAPMRDRGKKGGFFDGEKPFSGGRIQVHDGGG